MRHPNGLAEDLRQALYAARYASVKTVEEARPLVRELLRRGAGGYDLTDPQQQTRFLEDVKRASILKTEEREAEEQ